MKCLAGFVNTDEPLGTLKYYVKYEYVKRCENKEAVCKRIYNISYNNIFVVLEGEINFTLIYLSV